MKNARQLQLTAEGAAGAGTYGHACALLVLSAEEAIKSALFSMTAFLPTIDDAAQKLLHSHRLRHDAGFYGALILAYLRRLTELIADAERLHPDVHDRPDHPARSAVFDTLIAEIQQLADTDLHHPFTEVLDWFQNADRLKMHGLYTDFIGDAWSTPLHVTKAEYEQSTRVVNAVLGEMQLCHDAWVALSPAQRAEFTESILRRRQKPSTE